jgi:flagellar assembly protein FliH
LSRLVKGRCVNLDQECYVYHVPSPVLARTAGPAEEDAPEEDSAPSLDLEAEEQARYAEAQLDAQRRQAREIMREAELFRDETIAAAQREAERLREQARRDGFQKGYEQGRIQALAETAETTDRLVQLMGDLDRGKEALFKQQEQQLVDLALEIARKVVADRIEQDDESFVRIFKKAVEGLSGQKIVRLSVAERQLEFATSHADYLRSMVQDAEKLEIQVIEGATPGTLIVDTGDESIDASVVKQLEVLEQTVEDARYVRNT